MIRLYDNVKLPLSSKFSRNKFNLLIASKHLRFFSAYKKAQKSLLVGGTSNHLRPRSLTMVLEAMKLNSQSTFVDLGSSLGLPCILASLTFDLPEAQCRGIEWSPLLVAAARALAKEANLSINYTCADIGKLDHEDLRGVTHLYSFDAVFLPDTFKHIKFFIDLCTTLKTFASAHSPTHWPKWSLQNQVRVRMGCSGQAFTIYVYTRYA